MAYPHYGAFGYVCSSCGRLVNYDDNYCRNCGEPLDKKDD